MFAGVVEKVGSDAGKSESRYSGLVDAAEDDALAKVMDGLARKEEIALKMEATTTMAVRDGCCAVDLQLWCCGAVGASVVCVSM
jgi:hypothetical protein